MGSDHDCFQSGSSGLWLRIRQCFCSALSSVPPVAQYAARYCAWEWCSRSRSSGRGLRLPSRTLQKPAARPSGRSASHCYSVFETPRLLRLAQHDQFPAPATPPRAASGLVERPRFFLHAHRFFFDAAQALRAALIFFLRIRPLFLSAPDVPLEALLASRAHEVETEQWARHCLSEGVSPSEFGAPPAETEGSEGTRALLGRQPLARRAAHPKALSTKNWRNESRLPRSGDTTPKRSNKVPAVGHA